MDNSLPCNSRITNFHRYLQSAIQVTRVRFLRNTSTKPAQSDNGSYQSDGLLCSAANRQRHTPSKRIPDPQKLHQDCTKPLPTSACTYENKPVEFKHVSLSETWPFLDPIGMQIKVMQAHEEVTGPMAFQVLRLAKAREQHIG
jgi:hypothetical protein